MFIQKIKIECDNFNGRNCVLIKDIHSNDEIKVMDVCSYIKFYRDFCNTKQNTIWITIYNNDFSVILYQHEIYLGTIYKNKLEIRIKKNIISIN